MYKFHKIDIILQLRALFGTGLDCFCLQMVLDLCIFLSGFRPDDFFTEESNFMDYELILAGS